MEYLRWEKVLLDTTEPVREKPIEARVTRDGLRICSVHLSTTNLTLGNLFLVVLDFSQAQIPCFQVEQDFMMPFAHIPVFLSHLVLQPCCA